MNFQAVKPLTKCLLLAIGLSSALVFSACKKDDDPDVTLLSPVAGAFVGHETCAPDPSSPDYTVSVYNTAANNGNVFIDNIWGLQDYLEVPVQFEATVNGNTLTMPQTTRQFVVDTDTFNIQMAGEGRVDGNILTFTFRIDGDLGADTCTFVGDRNHLNPPVQGGS